MVQSATKSNIRNRYPVKEKGLVIENFRHTIISNIIFIKELVYNIRIKASIKINDLYQ